MPRMHSQVIFLVKRNDEEVNSKRILYMSLRGISNVLARDRVSPFSRGLILTRNCMFHIFVVRLPGKTNSANYTFIF